MATDISATKTLSKQTPNDVKTPVRRLVLDISPVADGVSTVTTHTLQNIDKKYALVGGEIIFIDALTSAGTDHTVAFTFNGVAITGTITAAGSAKNLVYKITPNIVSATAALDLYGQDAVSPIVMTVGTGAITAGRFLMILDVIDVPSISEVG
jgi:hypothetical protein